MWEWTLWRKCQRGETVSGCGTSEEERSVSKSLSVCGQHRESETSISRSQRACFIDCVMAASKIAISQRLMGKSIFMLLSNKHFTSIWKVEYRNWSPRFSQYPFLHDENDTAMVSLAGYYCWILSFDVSGGVVSQIQKLGCLHQSYHYVGWHSHTPSPQKIIYIYI